MESTGASHLRCPREWQLQPHPRTLVQLSSNPAMRQRYSDIDHADERHDTKINNAANRIKICLQHWKMSKDEISHL